MSSQGRFDRAQTSGSAFLVDDMVLKDALCSLLSPSIMKGCVIFEAVVVIDA